VCASAAATPSEAVFRRVCWPAPVLSSAPAPRFPAAERAVVEAVARGRVAALLADAPVAPHLTRSADRCCLYPSSDRVYETRDLAVAWHMAALFAAAAGLCAARVSRFDLHHAHLFYDGRAVGLLFHAREYPARGDAFPHDLGYCQRGSDVVAGRGEMRRRNVLHVLGDDELQLLAPERLQLDGMDGVHTVDEGLFGARVADVFLLGAASTFRVVPLA
jgi:hypothetical protein